MAQTNVRVQTIGGGLYFLIALGFGIYFYRHADTFWGMATAVVKALFWPVPVTMKVAAMLNL